MAPPRATTPPASHWPSRGSDVIVQRNVHSSTIDGLIVSGLRPAFVAPELDPDLGIAHCLTPAALDAALAETPAARRDGGVAHLLRSGRRRARAGRRGPCAGVPLIVDEAWGAHSRSAQSCPTTRSRASRPGRLEHPQDHRELHAIGDAAPGRRRHARRDVVDRAIRRWSPPAELVAAGLARRRAQLRGGARRRAARRDGAQPGRARQAIRGSRGWTCWTSGS